MRIAVGAAALAGSFAAAESSMQPPMNSFNYAYYNCDNGGAFLISYNGPAPTKATMTTSNDNKSYVLKRTPVDKGVKFSGAVASFWTDDMTVVVNGTQKPILNCKIKPS
jgi:membrane-bound inhibitor of C-type lysozyme